MIGDVESCLAFNRTFSDASLERAVTNGIIRYDGPSAETCLAELAALSCDASSKNARLVSRACADVFIGERQDGEVCGFDEECRSGSCQIPACGDECCFGECRERLHSSIGGPCEVDAQCVPETFCGNDMKCHALVPEGGECVDDAECEFGAGCISPSELMPGNCRKLPALGEVCLYMRCADINGVCRDGSCIELGLPGAECVTSKDCSPFAQCNDGICTPFPQLGEPCAGPCAGDSYCDDESTNLCAKLKTDSEPCGAGDECASGFCKEGVAFASCEQRPICF